MCEIVAEVKMQLSGIALVFTIGSLKYKNVFYPSTKSIRLFIFQIF